MLFSGDGDWECGVPVRTAGSDPYTTLYQKEYGLFEKMKNNDGLWGTQLEGKMTGRTYSALESPEIQIPENADDSVLEFSSYNISRRKRKLSRDQPDTLQEFRCFDFLHFHNCLPELKLKVPVSILFHPFYHRLPGKCRQL